MKQVYIKRRMVNLAKDGKPTLLGEYLSLREWCRDNVKGEWNATSVETINKSFIYFIFRFESEKDEMLFRLYANAEE